ncbi:MAG TPA: SH3 domain-containing protein [Bacillota bacterium]|nr:SH3 domain-containing protein [Bacillota bacterium]
MERKKGIYIFLLTLFSIGLIIFIGIMQIQFMNPTFDSNVQAISLNLDETVDDKPDGEEPQTPNDDENEADDDSTSEDQETVIKYVDADILNVRSGPSADAEIVGQVTYNEALEVEELDNADGWVYVKNENVDGYVNGKYLREENTEE